MSPPRRPNRGRSRLTPLSESLGQSLGRGYLHFMAQKLRVFEVWPRVVGPEDAGHTRPEMFYEGRLTVAVPGPAWKHAYQFKKTDWMVRLNNELADQARVEDIIFEVGEF